MTKYRIANEYKKWLKTAGHYQYFVTLTLKQSIVTKEGQFVSITFYDCQRTAWIFRDRLTKRLLTARQYELGERLGVLSFIEGISENGRFCGQRAHIHSAIQCPASIDPYAFKQNVFRAVKKLYWVHELIDVRTIAHQSNDGTHRVIDYCFKQGTDSFCPQASYFTSKTLLGVK